MTRDTVNLYYTRCGAATASALAIANGWLQQEFSGPGTVLESLRDSASLKVRNSHYNHSQSGMFREGGNIPPIWAKGAGQHTVVVAITWLDEYQGILVRDDGPIRELADLQGRRLGVPLRRHALVDFQRGAAQHGFETALKLAGLHTADATPVDLETPDFDTEDGPRPAVRQRREVELDALRNGSVDAIFLRFASGVRAAREAGVRELVNLGRHADPLARVNNGTPRPVTVDRTFLDRHPDVVARYLAVLLRTAAWAAQHHDDVVRLLLPESEAASTADVVASHGADVHRSFTPTLSAAYIAGLTAQKNFLRDWGFVKNDFDVADWIATEPLAQAQRLFEAQPALPEPSEARLAVAA
jgi:sulfonate transport system substrate-binding protein